VTPAARSAAWVAAPQGTVGSQIASVICGPTNDCRFAIRRGLPGATAICSEFAA
jgi:hypothetical protein